MSLFLRDNQVKLDFTGSKFGKTVISLLSRRRYSSTDAPSRYSAGTDGILLSVNDYMNHVIICRVYIIEGGWFFDIPEAFTWI